MLRVSDELVKVLVEGKYRAKLTELDTTGDFCCLPCALLRYVLQSPKRLWRPRRCSAPSRPALTSIWA